MENKRYRCAPSDNQNCPVDCEVGAWSAWTQCNTRYTLTGDTDYTCLAGIKERFRSIVHNAKFGGKPCPLTNETQSCDNTDECGAGCETTSWSEWSPCQAVYHDSDFVENDNSDTNKDTAGFMRRTRSFVNITACANAADLKSVLFQSKRCKIDCRGQFGDWYAYRSDGKKLHGMNCYPEGSPEQKTFRDYRVVQVAKFGGAACPKREENTSAVQCPKPTNFTGSCYGECDGACGGGSGKRHRIQTRSYDILQKNLEVEDYCSATHKNVTEDCVNDAPCPVDCKGHWGNWDVCPVCKIVNCKESNWESYIPPSNNPSPTNMFRTWHQDTAANEFGLACAHNANDQENRSCTFAEDCLYLPSGYDYNCTAPPQATVPPTYAPSQAPAPTQCRIKVGSTWHNFAQGERFFHPAAEESCNECKCIVTEDPDDHATHQGVRCQNKICADVLDYCLDNPDCATGASNTPNITLCDPSEVKCDLTTMDPNELQDEINRCRNMRLNFYKAVDGAKRGELCNHHTAENIVTGDNCTTIETADLQTWENSATFEHITAHVVNECNHQDHTQVVQVAHSNNLDLHRGQDHMCFKANNTCQCFCYDQPNLVHVNNVVNASAITFV